MGKRPSQRERPVSIPPDFNRGHNDIITIKDFGDITDLGVSLQDSNLANVDQIDQIQDLLNINLANYGFGECGNLRSTKRKDVRLRIQCI